MKNYSKYPFIYNHSTQGILFPVSLSHSAAIRATNSGAGPISSFQNVQEAHNSQPDNCAILDTLGYVQIVFGDTYDKVRDGLNRCEEAYKNDPNKKIAAPYFHLHRKAAYKHLMEL